MSIRLFCNSFVLSDICNALFDQRALELWGWWAMGLSSYEFGELWAQPLLDHRYKGPFLSYFLLSHDESNASLEKLMKNFQCKGRKCTLVIISMLTTSYLWMYEVLKGGHWWKHVSAKEKMAHIHTDKTKLVNVWSSQKVATDENMSVQRKKMAHIHTDKTKLVIVWSSQR